ncbi:MAG TPA: ABC transporter permease [Aggregatilineales bacterium]|nr:ABC transporter permease [Aggregatilineales bacterium]
MNRYRAGAIGLRLLSLFIVFSAAFVALRLLPGDPVTAELIQSGADQSVIDAQRRALGLDQPLIVQYGRAMLGLFTGDLGQSLVSGVQVRDLIAAALGHTLALAGASALVALTLGLTLGVVSGAGGRGLGSVASAVTAAALSVPIYWSGTLAVLLFSVWLNILPSSGSDSLAHLILPAAVLGFHAAGAVARSTHLIMRETLAADHVRTARAKGLSRLQVLLNHALRTAAAPLVAIAALQIGFLLSGTVVIETLFVRPGLGRLLLDAALRRDYPVALGAVIIIAGIYLLITSAADWIIPLVDPRIRTP